MNKRRFRFAPGPLRRRRDPRGTRIVQSAATPSMCAYAEVATRSVRKSATETTLAATAGTLGQPITFTVTVHALPAAAGAQGTVEGSSTTGRTFKS